MCERVRPNAGLIHHWSPTDEFLFILIILVLFEISTNYQALIVIVLQNALLVSPLGPNIARLPTLQAFWVSLKDTVLHRY